jgi:hypothetical protein
VVCPRFDGDTSRRVTQPLHTLSLFRLAEQKQYSCEHLPHKDSTIYMRETVTDLDHIIDSPAIHVLRVRAVSLRRRVGRLS